MTENTTAGGELAGLRVMVIDDSKTIRRTAETLLKREGCEVVTATDGFEALAKIADQQPQIIFVDIMMPRLDGYQTCALIKGNQLFKATPVIMLSSKDGLFDKARGRIVGSEQYLTKPFTREELLASHPHTRQRLTGGKGTMARIVLIEDSPTDRAVFTQWLRRAGHEVLEADNAEDGLQLAARQADLV
jgi:twitching motility two-component system response regulator PilG